APQIIRLATPLVDQRGVRRGDVELDQLSERRERLDEQEVLLDRLARHRDDQRYVMRQGRQGGAVGLEARIPEAVAVDQARPLRRPPPHHVRLRVAGTRVPRDALRRESALALLNRRCRRPAPTCSDGTLRIFYGA